MGDSKKGSKTRDFDVGFLGRRQSQSIVGSLDLKALGFGKKPSK